MAPLVWFMVLGFSTLVSSNEQGKNIFILAGQSNMAGRGWLADGEVPPPECKPNPKILRFSSSSLWEEAHDPLHRDIDITKNSGIGPGMPFANKVLEKNPEFGVIGLVPCAVGGTALSQWFKGSPLYETMVIRARASLSDGGVIRALLWYQGENDMNNTNYGAQYAQFVTDVRSDLRLPNLPVIQVAVNQVNGTHDFDIIRRAQLTFNFPNVKTVDAYGQPLEFDNLHLAPAGCVNVGQMMADTFLKYFVAASTTSS